MTRTGMGGTVQSPVCNRLRALIENRAQEERRIITSEAIRKRWVQAGRLVMCLLVSVLVRSACAQRVVLSSEECVSYQPECVGSSLWDDGSSSAITCQPMYTGEIFSNTCGGISTDGAARYLGLLDVPLTVDFDELKSCWLPGRFHLLAQTTHGQGITRDYVGDAQILSNIDPYQNIAQVSEYWWECGVCDDDVRVRLGKQDLNTEFLLMETASDFVHSAFGLSPAEGFPSYPNPSMAAVVLTQLTPSLTLKLGLWDGLAKGGTWGFSGNDVFLGLGELECRYSLDNGRLPGTLTLGAGFTTSGVIPLGAVPSARSCYVQLEQLVCRESSCDAHDLQGLSVFAQYLPSDIDGPTPLPVIPEDFVAGVIYRGPIAGRGDDVVGAGVAWARLERGGTNRETAVEVFYRVQMTEQFSIQPDVQYISSPSGIYRDALVAGLRVRLEL